MSGLDHATPTQRRRSDRSSTPDPSPSGADAIHASVRSSTLTDQADVLAPSSGHLAPGGALDASRAVQLSEAPAATTSLEAEREGELTADGGSGSASIELAREGERLSASGRAQVGGSFSVEVVEVPEEEREGDSQRFAVVLTVELGAEVAGSVGVEGQLDSREGPAAYREQYGEGSASVSGSAGASATLTYTHLLDEQGVAEYLSRLESAAEGTAVDGRPEFAVVQRLQTAAGLVETAGSLVDAASARSVAPGDSLDLVTEVHAGAQGSAAAEGGLANVGVSGGAEMSEQRHVRMTSHVDAEGRQWTGVTIEIGDSRAFNVGAEFGFGRAAASASYEEHSSGNMSATFVLPTAAADYDAVLGRVLGVSDRADIQALCADEDLATWATAWEQHEADGSTRETGLGALGLGLNLTSEQERELSVRYQDGELSGEASGTNRQGGEGTIAGLPVLGQQTETSAEASVSADGESHWEFSSTDSRSGVRNLDMESLARIASGREPRQELERELRRTLSRMHGYSLDEEAIHVVVRRASDEHTWNRCSTSRGGSIIGLWSALRRALVSPRPEAHWVAADPERADALARCVAVSEFVSLTGESGMGCIHSVLREWGETGRTTYHRGGRDVGLFFEWPMLISWAHTTYEDAMSRHATLDSQVAAWEAGGAESAAEGYNEVRDGLQSAVVVRRVIAACDAFRFPQAKLEMLEQLDGVQADFEVALERLNAVRGGGELLTDEVVDVQLTAARIRAAEDRMRQFQHSEDRLLDRVREDGDDDERRCSRVWNLHDEWKEQIDDLRELYRLAGTPESEWIVRSGHEDQRTAALGPDWDRLERAFRTHWRLGGQFDIHTGSSSQFRGYARVR